MATPRERFVQTPFPGVPGTRIFYDRQIGQNGNRRDVLPYSRVKESTFGAIIHTNGSRFAFDAGNAPGANTIPGRMAQSTYNSAYGRMVNKMHQKQHASLGVTLAEYRQSSEMIRNRAVSLQRSTEKLHRKWESKWKKGKRVPRKFADYWLEYSFGWAPLFGDIWTAYKVMCTDPPAATPIGGSAKAMYRFVVNSYHFRFVVYKVKVFAKASVTNPNVYLLNQLGLLNPALIAWEKIKFSFILDWLFDIGNCISSWTDFLGVSVTNRGWAGKAVTWSTQIAPPSASGGTQAHSLVAFRQTGIPSPLPNTDISTNFGTALARAANALAVVTQLLTSEKPRIPRRR